MKLLRNSRITPIIGLVIGAVIGFICFRLTGVNAGNLEPSAPPGSTMKTLDEVEPRIPIPKSATPAATFTINASGSYYLTGDRSCSETGITINADNVTIDLNGYSLVGSGAGVYQGIYMHGRKNVEICNGTIRSFGNEGILEDDATNGVCHRIISIRTIGNGLSGIYLNCKGAFVKECTSSSNGNDGIRTQSCSAIISNMVYSNTNHGIYVDDGCTIERNTINDNGKDGISGGASKGLTVIGNTCRNNGYSGTDLGTGATVVNNTADYNARYGIRVRGLSVVINNTVSDNNTSNSVSYAGLCVLSDCIVRGNTVSGNKQYDIYTNGADNAVENNLVTRSIYGIYFQAAGCFYADNRASGNVTAAYGGDVPTGSGDGGGNVSF